MPRKEPTVASILQDLATSFHGVVNEREVFDRVLERRPSTAKNPTGNIRQLLRFGAPRLGWVWLGNGTLMPLHAALSGLRFRVVPSTDELAAGAIARVSLRPFVPPGSSPITFVDAKNAPIASEDATLPLGEGLFGTISTAAIGLRTWLRRQHVVPGDSILVTIRQVSPLVLQLDREAASAFRAEEVAQRDQELLEALVDRVSSQRGPLASEDTVLPIFARAAWRTGYPGRPWQELVASDRRIGLMDGEFLTDSRTFRSFSLMSSSEDIELIQAEHDAELLEEINTLQEEILASRRSAAESGIWDGIAPRNSTAQTFFDFEEGTATTVHPGSIDALHNHTDQIEKHIVRGDYEQRGWETDEVELGEAGFDEELEFDDEFAELDDELSELDDIHDLQAFIEQNPDFGKATRRLMESLSPDEVRQLEEAETIDDVQRLLAGRLNDLIRREPNLFMPLLVPPDSLETHTNGSANGNGHKPGEEPELLSDDGWVDDITGESDDDEAGEPLWVGDEESEAVSRALQVALERSSDLMEQFVAFQRRQGKSETTAVGRAQDLWLYADFLGNYYGRALDTGDYATLDECVFYFYPRKVLNSSPRAARELCTSLKQFYAFLKTEGSITDDSFAQNIWRRRDQAARVVELYERIDSESPQFERLFAYLFSPYSV